MRKLFGLLPKKWGSNKFLADYTGIVVGFFFFYHPQHHANVQKTKS
jgi:hypothetical protein